MRVLVMLAVAMTVALVGCGQKAKNQPADTGAPPDPKHVSSVGGSNPVNPNQSGNLTGTGGQGAIQSTRTAAARTVNMVQLKQLHLSMFQTWQLDNRVQTANEVMQEARQNPQLLPLLTEEVIILTRTTRGDGVWAYTQYPQRSGSHYVVTQQGVVEMAPDDLKNRLQQQMSPVKLAQ